MAHHTREHLAHRRSLARRQRRHRHRRVALGVAGPLAVVALLVAVFVLVGARSSENAGPLAPPVAETVVAAGRPPDLAIARGEGVTLKVPVDPAVITAAAFHPIGDPTAVAMESTGALDIKQIDRNGRLGPETAGLDIGAPAGTPVYSPVDGVVVSVADYKADGRLEGFEVSIAPDVASRGVVVRMMHLDDPERGGRPQVGSAVQAGETLIGRVRDFSPLGRQELAEFTSDSGNHVHMELIHTRADLLS
ncbi:MAG TPA: M23 family metallopeptidase [Miltoncostaeaceae bacterium]|nr:M23 family metallopeptidase [Miltoncostaeaceae bacterium]